MAISELWKTKNFNIDDNDQDKKIYHIMSKEHFLSDFKNNKLTLINPRLWKDPFEMIYLEAKFISKATADEPYSELKFGDVFKCVFGKSWTFLKESNLMWEVYSKNNKETLKIETTVGKLQQALKCNNNNDKEMYYGKIKYVSNLDYYMMIAKKNPLIETDSHNRDIYETLFFKTEPYKEETEFRVLFADKKLSVIQNTYELEFNWDDCIDMIELAPNSDIKSKSQLNKDINSSIKIKKSKLYNKYKLNIHIK